jgi:hypothetical protein
MTGKPKGREREERREERGEKREEREKKTGKWYEGGVTVEAQATCKAGPGRLIFQITPAKVNKTHLTRMTRGVGQQKKDKGKRSNILAYLEITDQKR